MCFPNVHAGFSLICRTVTPATGDLCVTVVIEDTTGDVSCAELVNVDVGNPNQWLPQGTILAVKEPFLRQSSLGHMLIRVDSPSDVVFLRPANPALRGTPWYEAITAPFDDLKAQGNAAFQDGKYEEAIYCYDMAIEVASDASVVYSNRAEALLRLSRFGEARDSARAALADDNSEVNRTPRLTRKALLRRGEASLGLRDWARAVEEFENVETNYPAEYAATSRLGEARQRLLESRTGEYQMEALAPTFGRLFKHDVADYVGPVKIVDIPGKGKGLIVTADVREGTLLLAVKAVVVAQTAKQEHRLVSELVQLLRRNPYRTDELYQLYSGEIPREPIPSGIIHVDRIKEICARNRVLIENELQPKPQDPTTMPRGLWILPSFINHSCIENVIRIFFGDVMFVKALRDLREGEEVLCSYLPHHILPHERSGYLSQLPFTCRCSACLEEAEASADQMSRRGNLFARCMNLQLRSQRTRALQGFVADIDATYRDSDRYRPFLTFPLLALADEAMGQGGGSIAVVACTRLLSIQPRMPLGMAGLVRMKLADIDFGLGGPEASKLQLAGLLDFMEKRACLKWPSLKQLVSPAIKSGDRSGLLTPLLEVLYRSRPQ
jgi:tetratricopeptide (TPR) repeat protein